MIGKTELNTGKFVVCNLKVVEPDITNSFSYSTISSILPTCEIPEVGGDGRVSVPWITWVAVVIAKALARELPRNHVMEDTEAITPNGMGVIVSELADSFILWADIGAGVGTDGVRLQVVPVPVTIGASGMVLNEVVVWIGDPEASWRLVSVEKRPTPLGLHDQVLVDVVLLFNGILNKDCVALDVVGDVLHNSQVVCAMKGEGSVETLMSSEAFAV